MKLIFLSWIYLGMTYAENLDDNLHSIAQIVNSFKTTWEADTNLASDLTSTFYKRRLGAWKSESNKLLLAGYRELSDIEIPEEFDSRKQWPNCPSISHIKDQGNCGSCWAVATASAFTDRLCIATNGTFFTPLSDEYLLSCCKECGRGCDGGYPDEAWSFLSRRGIVTGGGFESNIGCQPYSLRSCDHHVKGDLPLCTAIPFEVTPKCQMGCTNPKYQMSFENDHHLAVKGYQVWNDVAQIQKEIMTHGPVEAAFTVYSDFLTYKSGVYYHVTGKMVGSHAARIIGWGVENGTPYWLIINSWNTHWGDNGMIKVRRGQNDLGIEEEVTAAIPLLK